MDDPLYLTESDVLALLPMEDAIAAVRQAFRELAAGRAQNQPRRRLVLASGSVLHQMAASCGAYFGTKVYSTNVRYSPSFWFHLFDAETARPLAIMEANWLGQIRTGAASAVATDLLAAPEASSLGIIGSGFQARSQLDAVSRVRRLEEVRVWSRSPEKRQQFAVEMAERTGLNVRAVATAEEAVRGMAIVTTATFAREPVLESAWVDAGTHINAMGSNHPERREIPEALLSRASLIVVDSLEQARLESGELLLAFQEEDWRAPRLIELAAVVQEGSCGRSAADITLFKSNGLALEDVAAAGFAYENALKRNLGRKLKR